MLVRSEENLAERLDSNILNQDELADHSRMSDA
jgi:hypothetical protein